MRKRVKVCKLCERPGTATRPLSTRGKHQACAEEAVAAAIQQMATRDGPVYERWLEARRAAALKVLAELDTGA